MPDFLSSINAWVASKAGRTAEELAPREWRALAQAVRAAGGGELPVDGAVRSAVGALDRALRDKARLSLLDAPILAENELWKKQFGLWGGPAEHAFERSLAALQRDFGQWNRISGEMEQAYKWMARYQVLWGGAAVSAAIGGGAVLGYRIGADVIGQAMENYWPVPATMGVLALAAGARSLYRYVNRPRSHFMEWDPNSPRKAEEAEAISRIQALWQDRKRDRLSAPEILPFARKLKFDSIAFAAWLVRRLEEGPRAKYPDYFPAAEAAHVLSEFAVNPEFDSGQRSWLVSALIDWMGRHVATADGAVTFLVNLNALLKGVSPANLEALLDQLHGRAASAPAASRLTLVSAMTVVASQFPDPKDRVKAARMILSWVQNPDRSMASAAFGAAEEVAATFPDPVSQIRFAVELFQAGQDRFQLLYAARPDSPLAALVELSPSPRNGAVAELILSLTKADPLTLLQNPHPGFRSLGAVAAGAALKNMNDEWGKMDLLIAMLPLLADPQESVFRRACRCIGMNLKHLRPHLVRRVLESLERQTGISAERQRIIDQEIFRENARLLTPDEKFTVGKRLNDFSLLELEGTARKPHMVTGALGKLMGVEDIPKASLGGEVSGRVSADAFIGDLIAISGRHPHFERSPYQERLFDVNGQALKRESKPAFESPSPRQSRHARLDSSAVRLSRSTRALRGPAAPRFRTFRSPH